MKDSMKQLIDNKSYMFTQLDARTALKTLTKVGNILGSGVASGIGAVDTSNEDILKSKIDMNSLGGAIEKILSKLDDDKTIEVVENLLSSVLFESKSMNLDHINFHGNMLHLLKVVKASFEVNYKDFFEGASGIVGRLQKVGDMIQGSQTSKQESGE